MPYKSKIGTNCSINEFVWMYCAGEIEIDNFVRIGHRASIISGNHNYDILDKEIKQKGATVLSGVIISSKAKIAAVTDVSKNAHSNAIYRGIPAKLIKYRGSV